MQNFPNRLAQAITASGKPKGALADAAGVALSTVSRWLGGTVPKAETLEVISEFLGVDAKWLLTGQRPANIAESSANPKHGGIGESAHVVREDSAVYPRKLTHEERIEILEEDAREMARKMNILMDAFERINHPHKS